MIKIFFRLFIYQKKIYKFFIKSNLHYQIAFFPLLESYNIFRYAINLKYHTRSMRFKLWKSFKFYLNSKLLNFIFKVLVKSFSISCFNICIYYNLIIAFESSITHINFEIYFITLL